MNLGFFAKTIIILIIATLSLSAIKTISISYGQLEEARTSLKEGKHKQAILGYERCIQAYLPLLQPRKQAIEEMQSFLDSLEQHQNAELALEGWRRLRASILFSRSIFGQPNADLLQGANHNIARLAATTDTQGRMSEEAIEKELISLLNDNPKDVSGFWGVMQFLFLLSWIGLTCQLIWKWAESTKSIRVRMICGSFGSWLTWLGSLYLAG